MDGTPSATPNPPTPDRNAATLLLERAQQGDARAANELLGVVYQELRALAGSFFGAANPSHTLQPTALVHEAYLKLVHAPNQEWEGRRHFVAVAAKAMRQILANHARDKRAQKRGGGAHRITIGALPSGPNAADHRGEHAAFDPPDPRTAPSIVDALALEDAMTQLERLDPDQCRLVELRYFAGLSVEETAAVLGVSDRTVKREWRMAKAQLLVFLEGAQADAAAQADP